MYADIATGKESGGLMRWKLYPVSLNRVGVSLSDTEWPRKDQDFAMD
ncbi:hypothetical protein GHR37_26360 [Achromobacter xylosoxidans]|nr:hypothetical protein [Achromobacter xylosoxidans]